MLYTFEYFPGELMISVVDSESYWRVTCTEEQVKDFLKRLEQNGGSPANEAAETLLEEEEEVEVDVDETELSDWIEGQDYEFHQGAAA